MSDNREVLQPDKLPVTRIERQHFRLGLDVRDEVKAEMFPADHNDELWQQIPENLRDGLRRYMMEFIEPGRFLRSILENDLSETARRADSAVSFLAARDVLTYLFMCAPPECYGDRDAVDRWCARLVRLRLEPHSCENYVERRYIDAQNAENMD